MKSDNIQELVLATLEDLKAVEIQQIDVRDKTTITDFMIIATGTSTRHIKAMTEKLVEAAKANGQQPFGVEGQKAADWMLVDLGDVVVHIMTADARDYYNLEKLWTTEEIDKTESGASGT